MASTETSAATDTETIVREYFATVADRDLDAQASYWHPDVVGSFVGQREEMSGPEVREAFAELHAAFPDFSFEVLEVLALDDRATVRWRLTATFAGPGHYEGLAPNGARVSVEGCDVLTLRDGKVIENRAYFNGASVARQLGAMPPQGSDSERRMTAALNVRTRLAGLGASEPERVADGVWRIAGGFPIKMVNVFLIEDEGGVVVFDAGIRAMGPAVAAAATRMGGATRVILGNAHADHRGGAAALGAPVFCHPDERADAQGDGGAHYFDYGRLSFPPARRLTSALMSSWDGGPVEVAGTLDEGDEVAGFEVVHLPGHAPGLIGLWRASDRLAISNDCFAMFDPQTAMKGAARIPHPAFNWSTDRARESARKLAALDPATAWPGHYGPLAGDVRGTLERIAAG